MNLKNKTLQDTFESYQTSNPFRLARMLDLEIAYTDFPEDCYGYYTHMLNAHQVLINQNLSPEEQESVCEHMIVHHLLHKGIEFFLDAEAFKTLEKEKRNEKYVHLHRKLTSLFSV